MDKRSTITLAALLVTLTTIGQDQPYLTVKSPSGVPFQKLDLYLDSNRIRIQAATTDTSGKEKLPKSRLELTGRSISEADRTLLRNYLRDSFQTDATHFREIADAYRRITGARLERPLVELSIRVYDDSVYIVEGTAPRLGYALGDSVQFLASVRKIYDRSAPARQMIQRCLVPASPSSEEQGFPTPIAMATLVMGILLGGSAALYLGRFRRRGTDGYPPERVGEVSESLYPSAPGNSAPGQAAVWTMPPATLTLLSQQLSSILSQQQPVQAVHPIRSEEDLRRLLEECKKFVQRSVEHEAGLRETNRKLESEFGNVHEELLLSRERMSDLETKMKEKAGEAEQLMSERDAVTGRYEAAEQARVLSEAKVKKLEEDEKAMIAIAAKVRDMLDELYERIESMTAARRSNEEFEAEVLHAFIAVAVVSLSHFSIRAGRYLDADKANIDLLEGRTSARPALRVDAATSRNSVDTVAYFVYQILKAHKVQGLKGFNCMGYTIGS